MGLCQINYFGGRAGVEKTMRIYVAGGKALLRSGLCRELDRRTELNVVGETSQVATLLERVNALQPRVVVLSGPLEGCSAIECVRKLRQSVTGQGSDQRPAVLVFSRSFDRQHLFSFLLEDVSGYIHQNSDPDFVAYAVCQVGLGYRILSREAQAMLVEMLVGIHQELSTSEVAVLRRAAHGLTDDAIAQDLMISQGTVKNHLTNIYRKVPPVRSRAEAVAWAWITHLTD